MDISNTFDPLSDLTLAQFARPSELESLNLRVLTPFQRALLVIDGTVTKFLEAYTLEPLEILRLAQATHRLPESHPWLDAPASTEIAVRQVMIQGQYSRTLYVYAVSYVVLERLSEEARERLGIQGEGIGRILSDMEMETRREILWFGREHLADPPDVLQVRGQAEFISRTYRIIAAGKPIALINERFPRSLDASPSHH